MTEEKKISLFRALTLMWELLDRREKKQSLIMILLMTISGLMSAMMVGAVMPFLILLSNPSVLNTNGYLVKFQNMLGNPEPNTTLVILGGIAIFAIVSANSINAFKTYAIARFVNMRSYALSRRMFLLQLHQPYESFMTTPPAIMARQTIGEPSQLSNRFLMPLGELISSTLTFLIIFTLLLLISPLSTIIVIASLTSIFGLISILTRGKLPQLGKKEIQANTERGHVFQEVVRCSRDIKMSGQEEHFYNRFTIASKNISEVQTKTNFLSQAPKFFVQSIFFGGIILLCLFFLLSGDGQETDFISYIPTVGLFVLAGQRLLPEIQTIYHARTRLLFGLPTVEVLSSAHNKLSASAVDPHTGTKRISFTQKMEIKDIQYIYPDGQKGINVPSNLIINKGEKIGLVGESGAGKSTLISILMGLLEPTHGSILVDDIPLNSSNKRAWRKIVAQVPQEVMVLDTTLLNNIALGVEPSSINKEKAIKAIEDAQLKSWFDTLPNGLETEIMKGTASLSGGQRQRLGIARALYRDSEIVILDEATSALDTQTEESILQTLEKSFKDKTIISVAHRLSTLRNCTRIIKLDKTGIVFDGTWEQFNSVTENLTSEEKN